MVDRRFLRTTFLTAALMTMGLSAVWAGADFYGVKMKSEDFAQNVFLVDSPKIPDFANDRPGTDKRIYAYGYMSTFLGGGKGIALEVFNHSDGPIATDQLFRELTVVTYDGRRYDRAEAEMMWSRKMLAPGAHATFNFKFPGARIHKDEVRMVICSFDMGGTNIFLFPLTLPDKAAQKTVVKKKVVKKAASPEKFCLTPVKLVQSLFTVFAPHKGSKAPSDETVEEEVLADGVGEKVSDKGVPADYPLVTSEQVLDGVHYGFKPEHRQEVQEANKNVEASVQQDRPWRLSNPGKAYVRVDKVERRSEGLPRREARVLFVNPSYGFVVVDAGFENGFGKNVILNVMRSGRRIAKVMVTKPREKLSGAVILPEWRTRDEIRVGDLVGISP